VSASEKENLETIRMGEIGVVLAYGPDAILAGFVRGVAPRNLNALFQDTLDAIELKHTDALHDFSGDASPFGVCRAQLHALLLGQGGVGQRISTSRGARALLFGVPALLLLALAVWWVYSAVSERRWMEYAHRLQREPGIVVTQAEKRGTKFYIAGLRDPLAADPALLMPANVRQADLDPHWELYHSLAPQFASRRRLDELKGELEHRAFRFATGSADIPAEQRFLLEDVASQMIALIQAGSALGADLQVEVQGNHDPVGTENFNSALARSRAENTREALITLGVPAARVTAAAEDRDKETCSAVKEEERLFCRSASFRVHDSNQR
jgi:outer membrane protein OmpA-like peptidoglycan-associated protein